MPDGDWAVLYRQMSAQRRRYCDSFPHPDRRRTHILASALARLALSELTGLPPEDVALDRTPSGKPYAPGLDCHFSLSHSSHLVLCAAAPFPVGCDLQRRRKVSPALLRRVARAGFSGPEEDFFPWWTRQEAAGKLSGRGLLLSPLPPGLTFWQGTFSREGEDFDYCLCAHTKT